MIMMTNEGEGKDYDGNEIIQIKGTGHNVGEICWLSVKIYPKTEITGEELKNLDIEKSIEPLYNFLNARWSSGLTTFGCPRRMLMRTSP